MDHMDDPLGEIPGEPRSEAKPHREGYPPADAAEPAEPAPVPHESGEPESGRHESAVPDHAEPQAPPALPTSLPSPAPLAPVENRLASLDIMRGFALIGIFVVNIYWWADFPFSVPSSWPAPADQWTLFLTDIFASGKFLSLFSFLFGVGFAVQFDRAGDHPGFANFFTRRLLALCIIGVAHATLLSPADILIHYSLIGFALLAFRRARTRAIVTIAFASLSMTTFITLMLADPNSLAARVFERGIDVLMPPGPYDFQEVFTSGSFLEMVRLRLSVYLIESFMCFFSFFYYSLGMFLLGLAAWRLRVFSNPRANLPLILTVMAFGLTIGLPSNLLFSLSRSEYVRGLTPWDNWIFGPRGFVRSDQLFYWDSISNSWGGPAQCLFYAGSILLLCQWRPTRALLSPLANYGRMALTNYVLQSLCGVLIFSRLGLGLYGTIPPHDCVKIVAVVVVAQIFASNLWMHAFRFGPMEWVWRSMTYGRIQPMIRAPAKRRGNN